jgi:small subunit ribosomal protein S8
MTDPIADMIIRIKNAFLAKKKEVIIPHSQVKESMAKILKNNNYISDFKVEEKKPQSDILVTLKYMGEDSVITGVKRLSKPGRRSYFAADKIPQALNGYGITIVSTNKGLMIDKDARKQNLGGEALCSIW